MTEVCKLEDRRLLFPGLQQFHCVTSVKLHGPWSAPLKSRRAFPSILIHADLGIFGAQFSNQRYIMHVSVESVSTGLKASYNIYSFKITYDINITVPFLQLNELQYTVVKVPIFDISTDAVTINCTCNSQSKMIDTFMIHTFYEDFFLFYKLWI